MFRLLDILLHRIVRSGSLTFIDADGMPHRYGDGRGRPVVVQIADKRLEWHLVLDPQLALGEGYMQGRLKMIEGRIYDFLELLLTNIQRQPEPGWTRGLVVARYLIRRLLQFNPSGRARRNVAHHYDINGAIYDLFLDRDRQYSCAYFRSPEDDLDTAQENKKRHIAAKLLLQPSHKVLDIGSGWAGLALYLAAECGCDVTGLTLSEEQHKVAQRRAAAAGLADRVRFHLRDYREEEGRYDRIVSVGMFEHVGVVQYPTFFRKVNELLAPDGVALLHSIGRMEGPGTTNPWLRKYIFPGGYSPALSEVVPVVERERLWITDVEILRLHYAETLRHWRARFEQNRERIRALYDERFCRMWELYLVGAEMAFRRDGHLNFQMQLAKQVDTVPLTRDYITDWERTHTAPSTRSAGRAA